MQNEKESSQVNLLETAAKSPLKLYRSSFKGKMLDNVSKYPSKHTGIYVARGTLSKEE